MSEVTDITVLGALAISETLGLLTAPRANGILHGIVLLVRMIIAKVSQEPPAIFHAPEEDVRHRGTHACGCNQPECDRIHSGTQAQLDVRVSISGPNQEASQEGREGTQQRPVNIGERHRLSATGSLEKGTRDQAACLEASQDQGKDELPGETKEACQETSDQEATAQAQTRPQEEDSTSTQEGCLCRCPKAVHQTAPAHHCATFSTCACGPL